MQRRLLQSCVRGIEILLNTSLSDATDGNLQLINMADKSPPGESRPTP